MIYKDIIIIGCGASGSMVAMEALKKNSDVAIIDLQNKPAKKILVTGNGRCNLTNLNTDSSKFNQNIDCFLKKFNVNETLKYFNEIGLEYYSDEEGRFYPISNVAKSVVDVITNNLKTKIYLEKTINSIEKQDNLFIVKAENEVFSCKKLVIATGGNTFKDCIKSFGIKYKDCSPSLVALKTESTKALANVRLSNVLVKAYCHGNVMEEKGEILFKDSGLSGISIFNLSSLFARNGDFSGTISIDLLPNYSLEQVQEMLTKRKTLNVQISKYFEGLFANPIGYEILNRCKLDENRACNMLNMQEICQFAEIIKNMTFSVKGHYDNNQVYSGGVVLDELKETLESKKVENLYFCGEVCDVDGLCGGYNLQWAWTSGKIVGENL